MKKLFSLTLLLTVFVTTISAQEKKFSVYGVGFYNLENLFDTCHDEGKNDYEYLPSGGLKWTGLKYSHKLHNMAQALSDMGTDVLKGVGCAFIGVSEVENAKCLADLCAQEPLKARNFQFCHVEGPDQRGVDCALLYNPSLFTVRDVKLVPYVYDLPKDSARATRGFLTVSGNLAGEHVTVIVNHLPSRFAGPYYRELGARQIAVVKDSLVADDPNVKVFVMGDMNDDPMDASMAKELRGRRTIEEVGPNDLYNPWWDVLAGGTGTLSYRGSWNLFDQILLSPNLLNPKGSKDYSTLKFWKNQIVRQNYLFQTEGRYKGSPKRTHASGVWLDGYSDHLPVVVYLVKEQK
ncbi:endonuclease/exonuclease/phosphatase family protein [Prevotella sp.]|uniref:endonuclease/exonuclease/phosphatase family protein n=1 Tax=Prevotella sp. TaxID=59823 RepID=UPI002F927AA4